MSPQLGIAVAIVAVFLAVWAALPLTARWRRIRSAARRKAALDAVAHPARPWRPDPLDVTWRDDPDRDRPLRGDVAPPPPRHFWARRPRRAWLP